MRQQLPRSITSTLAVAVLALVALTGCSGTSSTATGSAATDDSAAASGAFPVTVSNCGSQVTLTAPARRIVLVNNDSLPNLEALGVVDRVVALTQTLQPGLYSDDTYSTLSSLAVLSTQKNATGGSIVSQESILGAEPDLVIAPENAVDRAALNASGIAVYTPSAYCANPGAELSEPATFDRVWDEVRTLGRLTGETSAADDAVAKASADLATPAPITGTAAALYVSSGGGVLSPYGGPSMVTPVFAAAGLSNVYADSTKRVFDANVEDIISRNPGTIVLLYSSGDPADVTASFLSAPGVSGLAAVQAKRVVALKFPYTDPPSMLSVTGPAELRRLLAALS
ncbi:ABC transporter substrate-binding protein [Agreia sp. COWG]|uniref:ABC transporter substrate-binding protein n=1 Tax=Agreia sp. COWG TaxID=2773266 RepID=UPI0019278D27|nr:ABC transporter substrate-binding protein [Agreia sp. COWG]CAD6011597.1 Fe/B12 periplasmic-binding domain-containing protein [Agreia sp. COWG]